MACGGARRQHRVARGPSTLVECTPMNAGKTLATVVLLGVSVVICARAADAPAQKSRGPAPKPGAPATQPATQPSKPGKVGNIRYSPPGGWEVSEKENIVILNPPGETPKTCSVILVSGEVIPDGDFIKWFKDK